LRLTDVKSMSGEASIAVIRGEPRMGYELTIKAEFTGENETYLEGMKCEVEVEEMCDDQGDPESFKINVISCLDTNQGAVAKEVLGYDNQFDLLCSALHKCLKEYPYKS